MKDDGLLTRVAIEKAAFESNLIDCAVTFDAIINLCSTWLDTVHEDAQKLALIIALAEAGKNAATASMEV